MRDQDGQIMLKSQNEKHRNFLSLAVEREHERSSEFQQDLDTAREKSEALKKEKDEIEKYFKEGIRALKELSENKLTK